MDKTNNEQRNITTKKIKIYPIVDIADDAERKNKLDEMYSYLRNSIFAQNKAFNILLSSTYAAMTTEQGKKKLDDIYFSYSHQKPDPSADSLKNLQEVLEIAPITQEVIEEQIANLKQYLLSKKKPPNEKKLNEALDKKRKFYEKYLGKSREYIQDKIDRLSNYCAYPADIYNMFANGFSTPAYVTQQVRDYWKSSQGEDTRKNIVSLRSVKMDNPLIIPPNLFYDSNGALYGLKLGSDVKDYASELLSKRNIDVFLELPYKKESVDKMRFRLELGNVKNSNELRCSLINVFDGTYRVVGSKIGFVKNKKTQKDTDIMLYLSLSTPKMLYPLDEGITVGVDLGQKIPAYCTLNINEYTREAIGTYEDCTEKKQQFKKQRERCQSRAKKCKGGHGRDRKLKWLNRYDEFYANFSKTYNHYISKRVVDFAVKNHAKYINIENLSGMDCHNKLLWNPGQVQEMITYKAQRYGIEVRKVNPYYTSQACSCCGHWEEGQRIDQEHFVCKKCGIELNADRNASRNIALSIDFCDGEISLEEKRSRFFKNYKEN